MYRSALNDEKELLRQVAGGDERAFTRIFDHYHQRLGHHIFRITRSEQVAEELVHDVFLKIWRNRELLVEIENFPVYLFVISKNAALNALKKLAAEKMKFTGLDEAAEGEAEPDDYRYALIDEAIDQLPPQQRQVYLLSRHQRLSYHEIALQMGLSKETVKKYLQIATAAIITYIGKSVKMSPILVLKIFF
ncbi:MAG: RNA polymerase subunit sigma-24 [Dyadobacter sp. 50-39]|uniref:RNA polymerase sigma factor n=1 Tax=Dyadobacter sp. 50-39 TaxID=1895756 RepID=UPI00096964F4|nr:sigma-70 family RNA polymerase sigma factor [Dyadobacter sp. 50-39]OJV14969.1 MAG: RNA polymerase subunit sigma-24 [Dyadobacter sp. 50-39]